VAETLPDDSSGGKPTKRLDATRGGGARRVRRVARALFFGPPDWLVRKTTVEQRRAINFWLLIVWIVPGALIWWLVRDALWFVGFMSLYAIWVSHLTNFSAETPVEQEE
jgi:hypothetical protein